MLSQKAQNADQGTDHKKMLTKKARVAVNKAMHLLAIELNLERCFLELTVANAIAKRRIMATMQSEVRTKERQKIRNLPPLPQAQEGKPNKDSDRESGEPTNDCAGILDKDGSTSEDGIPKGTFGEQLQKMQDKADVIFKLQRELWQDIQIFKLSPLQDRGTNSDMVNT